MAETPSAADSASGHYRDLALADLIRVRLDWRNNAAAAAIEYGSRFQRWEQRASVRRPPRPCSTVESGTLYFPPEQVPVLGHPLVRSLGADTKHRLLVRRLYDYLNFTVELEQLAVIPIAMKISRGQAGLHLPSEMRSDAFKIVTDEAWHAQFSYDLIRQVERETGIPYATPVTPAFVGRLDAIRVRLPAELRGLEGLLFAVVSETLISRILADLPRDRRLPTAVRDIVHDHAMDEARHHAYFRSVLQHLWPALDISLRRHAGQWIPEMVFAFLEPDYDSAAASLHDVGLTGEQIADILTDSLPRTQVVRDVAHAASAAVRYFQEVGALRDGATKDAFVRSGLITPDAV